MKGSSLKTEHILCTFLTGALVLLCGVVVYSGEAAIDQATETEAKFARIPPKVKPALQPYELKPDLSNVENLQEFAFTNEQTAFLVKNHLLIYDGGLANPVSVYRETPVPFITSDIMLHVSHVLASNTIEEAESVILRPALATFLRATIESLLGEYEKTEGKTRMAAGKSLSLLGAAAFLLGESVRLPDHVRREVEVLADQIAKGNKIIFDGNEIDASLFKPRAGYEASQRDSDPVVNRRLARERYFQAVTWLGQAGLNLDDSKNLFALVLLARIISDNVKARDALREYNENVNFLAGKADGLGPDELLDAARRTLGDNYQVSNVTDEQMKVFGDVLKTKAAIRILGTAAGAGVTAEHAPKRFFVSPGRYNSTGRLFQMLLEGQQTAGRMPSGLDYAAVVLDSFEANRESLAGNKAPEIRLMTDELNRRSEQEWYRTYDEGVQYSLRALVEPIPEGYPAFMRTDVWAKKSLNTALGGWVQISHDLFLYQKHAGYYRDGGGKNPRFSGYVEPNPDFYGRLAYSVGGLHSWFEKKGLFSKLRERVGETEYQRITSRGEYLFPQELDMVYATEKHYETLESFLKTLMELSQKELESEPFVRNDHEALKEFESILRWLAFDVGVAPDGTDKSLICDLATDYESGKVLEVAIGKPLVLVVIVPWDGRLYLSKGAVFNYYEFPQPVSMRLTDAQWKNSERNANDSWLGKQGLLSLPLTEIHDPTVLAKYLEDKNPGVRVTAARKLIKLKAVEHLPAILKLIRDNTEVTVGGNGRPLYRYVVSSEVLRELAAVKVLFDKSRSVLEEFVLSIGEDTPVQVKLQTTKLVGLLPQETVKSGRFLEYLRQRAVDKDALVRGHAESILQQQRQSP